MASIAPSHDHEPGEIEWPWEDNEAVDNALAELDHGSPDLFGWMTPEHNATFENALAELHHHGSSNQVEQRDPAQVQINDFIEDVQMTETSLVILPNNTGSTSILPKRKAKHPRIKAIPWTSDEHRLFLEGFGKYGKGYWRSISRFNVVTRTLSHVASHAQKYFIRLKMSQNNHGNPSTVAANANTATLSPR